MPKAKRLAIKAKLYRHEDTAETLIKRFPVLPYRYIYNREMDPWDGREEEILSAAPLSDDLSAIDKTATRAAMLANQLASTPQDIAMAYGYPLLNLQQERHLARRMNYCKYRATGLFLGMADSGVINHESMQMIERFVRQAADDQRTLICCNLRLVVNITKRTTRKPQLFHDILSDGYLSLLKAVSKFDYSLGFRLSTYTVRSIIQNGRRLISKLVLESYRNVTNNGDILGQVIDGGGVETDYIKREASSALARIVAGLNERDRTIIELMSGLGGVSPKGKQCWTLAETGDQLGLSKERVRQLYKRTLASIKNMLANY